MSYNKTKAALAAMIVAVITFVNFELFVQPTLITYKRGYASAMDECAVELEERALDYQQTTRRIIEDLRAECTAPPSHGINFNDFTQPHAWYFDPKCEPYEGKIGHCFRKTYLGSPEPPQTVE